MEQNDELENKIRYLYTRSSPAYMTKENIS